MKIRVIRVIRVLLLFIHGKYQRAKKIRAIRAIRGYSAVKILDEMLEIETKATQVIENAKLEATTIRNKAREDAKQLVNDGKKTLKDRLHQEIIQIEREAEAQRDAIFEEAKTRAADMERVAQDRMDSAAELVLERLFENKGAL